MPDNTIISTRIINLAESLGFPDAFLMIDSQINGTTKYKLSNLLNAVSVSFLGSANPLTTPNVSDGKSKFYLVSNVTDSPANFPNFLDINRNSLNIPANSAGYLVYNNTDKWKYVQLPSGIDANAVNQLINNRIDVKNGVASYESVYELKGFRDFQVGGLGTGSTDYITNDIYRTNVKSIIGHDGTLDKFEFWAATGGKYIINIGTIDNVNNIFTPRVSTPETIAVSGLNSVNLNIPCFAGEMVAISTSVSSGAATIYWNNAVEENDILRQYKITDGSYSAQIVGKAYLFRFTYSYADTTVYTSKFDNINTNLSTINDTISKITNQYIYNAPITEFSTNTTSNNTSNFVGYYFNKKNYNVLKHISKISINCNLGNTSFSVGSLDQWNKFIVRETYNYNATINGLNTFNTDILLNAGEYIVYNVSNNTTVYTNSISGGVLAYSQIGNPIIIDNTKNLSISYDISDASESDDALTPISDFNNLKQRVNFLENKTKIIIEYNGKQYEVAATLYSDNQTIYSNIQHFGNSLCKHPITNFWWGEWGMAATIRANDYVHQFLSLIQQNNSNAITDAVNVAATIESNFITDYSVYDSNIVGKDLIIIRIGENVGDLNGWKTCYDNFINYIKTKNPTVTIILGGLFWGNSDKETIIKFLANKYNLTYVELDMFDASQYKQTVDAQVFGDDNQWHTISDGGSIAGGVANHPNDLGHRKIAEEFYKALGYSL